MSELSINIGFVILGVIAVYLAIIFICNIIQGSLKKSYNKGLKDGMEVPDFLKKQPQYDFEEVEPELRVWLQKEMDKKQAMVEQFCDDLQRMKRLEEDSEQFQKLHLVKEK